MLFSAKDGKVKTIKQLDLPELFRIASQMYQGRKYPVAIKLYKRILTFFPQSKYRYAVLYNLALAYEDNKQYGLAIQSYQTMIKENPKRKNNVLNARFRLAACHNQRKEWKQALSVYDKILQGELTADDRIDALAYSGRALYHLKRDAQAIPMLRVAVLTHLRRQSIGKPQEVNYAAAMAQYYWGLIHDRKFRLRKFQLPQSQLKLDLQFKSKQLLRAQKLFFRTIKLRHADWALAALYRIGAMYEAMYDDMMKAPVPKDLKKEEILIYQELLRKKIKVLLAKALLAYRMNLRLAAIVGLKSHQWQKRSVGRFRELLGFYQKHFGEAPSQLKKFKPLPFQQKAPASRPTSRPAATKAKPAARTTPSPKAKAAPASRPTQKAAPAKQPTKR